MHKVNKQYREDSVMFSDMVGMSNKNEENSTLRIYARTGNYVGTAVVSLTDYIAT